MQALVKLRTGFDALHNCFKYCTISSTFVNDLTPAIHFEEAILYNLAKSYNCEEFRSKTK